MTAAAPTIDKESSCFHCGLEVRSLNFCTDEHRFCCIGCLHVYQLLHQTGLSHFYQLSQSPGSVIPSEMADTKHYEYLDDSELLERILAYRHENIAIVTLKIPSIHCISCIWLLENIQRLEPGVKKSRVNFLKKEVRFHFDIEKLPLSRLALLLERIGYKADFVWRNFAKKKFYESYEDVIKLGVAGFCFSNVMMLSFPEYLSWDVPPQYRAFLGYLCLLFCLPVLFYSASDWFSRAFESVKNRRISLDIPIINGVLVLFLISTTEVLLYHRGGYFDSLCAFVFFMLLARYFQKLAFHSVSFTSGVASYFPMSVTVLIDKKTHTIPLHKLAEGDVVFLRHGEVAPTDVELLTEDGLIDYSYLTGEAMPVSAKRGRLIKAGGKIIGKAIEAVAKVSVDVNLLEQIWEDSDRGKEKTVKSFADSLSPYFFSGIYTIAILGGLIQLLISGDLCFAFFCFASVLIITCPCALAISSPLVHGLMQRKLAHQGFFMRSGSLIEPLARINTIIFDKTGTLTLPGKGLDVVWNMLTPEEKNAVGVLTTNSLHPVSQKIAEYKQTDMPTESFTEIPGCGIRGRVHGMNLQVGSLPWLIGEGFALPTEAELAHSLQYYVGVGLNQKISAIYQLKDIFRENWDVMLNDLKQNYHLHLLSGDSDASRETLETSFTDPSTLSFRCSPSEKENYVKALKEKSKEVMMVGDGLNDQLALQAAQIGMAIVENTSHFSPSSDIILMGSRWGQLNDFLKKAKSAARLIYFNFTLSLLYNIVGVLVAVLGLITPVFVAILMPLSSMTVVLTAFIGTSLICRQKEA